ncbi:dinuclear metal center YbgI/SA1388 family protein [Methanohalophilus levihalophilus]|uniref:Nif3-like dinuclear metal center hexameric protein n=1 Tax=Methanohalophilus levihalophilus TaxID=1431282 RepID=UPI001AE793D3|nr:Nif3-like dinuclear metal center hexameric protein [Methanohalophilus levihalophilus]MBP2029708.1 dinuclear metal center YbgI/SA1388 family protein [Methanohalophilus levihalophilus]
MHLYEVVRTLEEIASPELAEDFDEGKIGLNLDLNNDINKIAVALDATGYVIERAADIDADLLVVHHPFIFHSINSISTGFAALLEKALANRISIYSMHTNFDKAAGGINDVLAKRLGLKGVEELEAGRVGFIDDCTADIFVHHVSKSLDTTIQYVGEKESITKVMVFGGSGFNPEYLESARKMGVDAYVSAELKHNIIRDFTDMLLVDATHYATENPGMEELTTTIRDKTGIDTEFIDHNPFIKVL